jgi:Cys-tRNA(Pro)/Cys-tRNA(Cys) deacylase
MAKKKKIKKTNEERILDQNDISYQAMNFDWLNKGQQALVEAQAAGIPAKSILKTIVLRANNDEHDYLVVCLPLEYEIDLKKVASELGKKQVHLADSKKLINITGYVHGANTPIGISFKKNFPIYFDQRIQKFSKICVSAGKIGKSVCLAQKDLITLVKGKYIEVQ